MDMTIGANRYQVRTTVATGFVYEVSADKLQVEPDGTALFIRRRLSAYQAPMIEEIVLAVGAGQWLDILLLEGPIESQQ